MVGRRRLHVLDEGANTPVLRAPDPDALLDAGQLVGAGVGARLGVGHVDSVVLGDEDAARPPELTPLAEELPLLVEDLNAVVLAITDEQPAARVHRNGVRLTELAR